MYKFTFHIEFTLNQHAHRFFHLGGTCTLLPSFLGVHVPFYLHFWGYIQIFGGAMYPLTLHLGVQRKWTAFSPRKVMHHAFFCKYYTVGEKKKILSDLGSDRKWGSVWPMAFVSVPPFFCNIVKNLSNFVFYTELNARLPIYSHDHWTTQLNVFLYTYFYLKR